jgi:hypothetical protein
MSAGARFTVIRSSGNVNPELVIADLTLSLLSFTAVSGSPTVVNAGSPDIISTSTSTKNASMPMTTLLKTFASTMPPYCLRFIELEGKI